MQNAATVWPESVRPLASVIVPDIIMGRVRPWVSKHSLIAKIAAFAFSVSNAVSIMMISAPPSISALVELL